MVWTTYTNKDNHNKKIVCVLEHFEIQFIPIGENNLRRGGFNPHYHNEDIFRTVILFLIIFILPYSINMYSLNIFTIYHDLKISLMVFRTRLIFNEVSDHLFAKVLLYNRLTSNSINSQIRTLQFFSIKAFFENK